MPIRLPQGNIASSDIICRRLNFIDGTEQTTAGGGAGPITPTRITLPQVNEPLTPTFSFGDGDSGFYQSVDNQIDVSLTGIKRFEFSPAGFRGFSANSFAVLSEVASATNPTMVPDKSDLDTGIGHTAVDQVSLIAGGVQVANLTEAAGVVQFILPQANLPATPALAFGDGDSGFYESVDDAIRVSIGGSGRFQFNGELFSGTESNTGYLSRNNATAAIPSIGPSRIDINTGLGHSGADQLSLVAGGVQVANLTEVAGVVQMIFPLQNNATAPSIAFGDGDSGWFETIDDQLNISISGVSRWVYQTDAFQAVVAGGPAMLNEAASATNPTLVPDRSDTDTGIGLQTTDQLALIAGGLRCLSVSEVGGARRIGFYESSPVALQTGVPVTTSAVHAALVSLGLITA